MPVAGGAELLTIFGAALGHGAATRTSADIPLVSILRDTLGDEEPANDRLRYVWMHTYANPRAGQRAASAVPFLYTRVANNKGDGRKGVPPHVIDLADTERDVWRKLFWSALQSLLFDPVSLTVKLSTRTLRRNAEDYRLAHVIRALAILALYEADSSGSSRAVFTPSELEDIQARLMLTQKTFGGRIDDLYLRRVYQAQTTHWLDTRGHNWELLRQRAEAEGLIFEPLELPDGGATHALIWTTRADLERNRARKKFDGRFLNIDSPWGDTGLRRWRGYTETRFFDAEGRRVAADAPDARQEEMIPLALYGLEHPKIPILLVDFRDTFNPKRREMSRRALKDVADTLVAVSRLELPFFLGRVVYDYVTEKRGIDLNQTTRLRAYSQLKLLLALDASLDEGLRAELERRIERVSLNPLENDAAAEADLAREQYAALVGYAGRPAGLPARLERDRREEMVPLKHNAAENFFLRLAHILSLGRYTHRERATPTEQVARLDDGRQFAHHRRLLREVAKTSSLVEVQWDVSVVGRALEFVAAHGPRADAQTAAAAAAIFNKTHDEHLKKLCLDSLRRIDNKTAKRALEKIRRDERLDARWRALSGEYLHSTVSGER